MVIIMGVCPNCGSWVDEGDVCGCCGGSGSYSYEDDDDEISFSEIRSEKSRYSRKAWDLYMDFRDEEALYYIDLALDLDIGDSGNWNRKAIILESLKRYPESLQCYDASLKRRRSATVMDNKARMLYAWACDLLEESKELPDGRYLLHKARKKISQSMDSLSPDTSEDLNKYVRLMDSIDFYIEYENKFHSKLEILQKYDKSELFTLTGKRFYQNSVVLTEAMALKLVKEKDNEFDSDAIAVYAEGEKIGYAANNNYTCYELTSQASELKDKIPDICEAEYLFYLDRYAEIQYHIARIIKED